jgi:hypothetical protein
VASARSSNRFGLSLHRLEVSAKKLAAESGTTAGNEREISAKKNYSSELIVRGQNHIRLGLWGILS